MTNPLISGYQEKFNEGLAKDVRWPVDMRALDDPHVKTNLLLQVIILCIYSYHYSIVTYVSRTMLNPSLVRILMDCVVDPAVNPVVDFKFNVVFFVSFVGSVFVYAGPLYAHGSAHK